MRALRICVLGGLLLTVGWPATAQLWRGPAALEIRAEGQGKPPASAEAKLELLDLDPPAGPAPVKLDSRGRGVVGGLAEGNWRVEVSAPGFMTWKAEIRLRAGDKPTVLASYQHNVPNAVHMMKVNLGRARSTPADLAQAETPAERPARPATPRPAPPATAAPAPRPEAAAPRPEPTPAPAPRTPPSRPVESPAPVEAPPAAVPAPQPTPAPAAPPVAETPRVSPGSRMTPPPAAQPSVRRRSFADRTCEECQPGQVALSVEEVVAPGGKAVLRLEVPRAGGYIGYRYEVQDGARSVDCLAGAVCPVGGAFWPAHPELNRSDSGTIVAANFENRSADRELRAILTVYFKDNEARRR